MPVLFVVWTFFQGLSLKHWLFYNYMNCINALKIHQLFLKYCHYCCVSHCYQMKGLNFPGCHDPRFCQFVCDRSRLLLRPVR